MVPELLAGRSVGTYSIRGLLGGTPWAQTHLATAPGKQVALKILDPLVAQQPGVLDDLRRVREALAGVPEHLILGTEDEGEDEETGARFLVSPFSEHPSLADLVEIFPVSPEEAVELLRNLATALEGVHGAGLAHLSVKPTNIFVGPPPTHTVRLGDFGADTLRRAGLRVHESHAALLWLAPEQLDGDTRRHGRNVGLRRIQRRVGRVLRDDRKASLARGRGRRCDCAHG
jgi:eukaryotic-like serine/threonine-protein kinase